MKTGTRVIRKARRLIPRLLKPRSKKVGMPPGSFIFVGERKVEKVEITVMQYNQSSYDFRTIEQPEDLITLKNSPGISWFNVYGLHEVNIPEKIGNIFNIHPLTMEDVLNTDQRPKIEIFDDYIFIVLKMIWFNTEIPDLDMEQISIILGNNYVICFQERQGDLFNEIRERIKHNKGPLRHSGTDFLTYRIMDVVVDNYFTVLEKMGDFIENLDQEIMNHPDAGIVHRINHLKHNLILLRKSIWPLREVVSGIERAISPLFKKTTKPFIRDLYDHTIQVIDTVENYRDLVSGLLDIHISNISYRMNEVMKVLTVIATIFIPLTFIAGIYGMNFEYMPELQWRWGYPAIWLVMLTIGGGMLLYFRKKNWF